MPIAKFYAKIFEIKALLLVLVPGTTFVPTKKTPQTHNKHHIHDDDKINKKQQSTMYDPFSSSSAATTAAAAAVLLR